MKSLAANKEIIVCKPDKSRGVVLLDKAIYLSKITELIADRTKIETISDAPDKYIHQKNGRQIEQLLT